MADKKISELTALTASALNTSADFLPIVDTSASQTKKIAVGDLPFATSVSETPGAFITGTGNIRFGTNQTSTGTTMFMDVENNRVGIRTDTPTEALDVNGTLQIGPFGNLNVSDKDFYVSGTESTHFNKGAIYTNLGDKNIYGTNTTNNLNQASTTTRKELDDPLSLAPRYSIASTTNGLLVKNHRYEYLSIRGTGLGGINSLPKVIIPSSGADKALVVKEFTVQLVNLGSPNNAAIGATHSIEIGSTVTGLAGTTFSSVATIPKKTINDCMRTQHFLYERDAPVNASTINFGNDIVMRSDDNDMTNASKNINFIRFDMIIKYAIYDQNVSFRSENPF